MTGGHKKRSQRLLFLSGHNPESATHLYRYGPGHDPQNDDEQHPSSYQGPVDVPHGRVPLHFGYPATAGS